MAKLIVGLGNPGPKYEGTRHNLGFMVLEELGKRLNVKWRSDHGIVGKSAIKDVECSLLMPMEFMNNSGFSVASLSQKKGIVATEILVVCDDLDLPFGKMRLRPSGSAGGHNGLKSIITALGSDQFSRL
ncbi:MAG: aminoacyl-tRNA hydrolase, partial [Candidatus Omnitrophica bacterium]|nr:aminoacyl-tRNA hydrolase [Candidatus Omnitrophota bacterium]